MISVLKLRNCVSFTAEPLIESKAGNYDKALALLMSAEWPGQLESARCRFAFNTCC